MQFRLNELNAALEGLGIEAISKNNLAEYVRCSNRAGFDHLLLELKVRDFIDTATKNSLQQFAPPLASPEEIAESFKRKPRPKSGKEVQSPIDELYFNKAYINSRVRDYVAEAVQGTPYEGTGDKLKIESAVMGMLEAVANGNMNNQLVQSMRTSMEKMLGDAGNTLFEATMEAASYYTGYEKFTAMRERPEHTHTVEALRNMRVDSTPADSKHEHTRSVLNKLVTSFIDADNTDVHESADFRTDREQEVLESLRSRGMFKEAVNVDNHFKSKRLKDPFEDYNRLLNKYFGEKARSADAVVRGYSRQLGHELKNQQQV